MEASSGRSRVRPIVVDFLATLFVTFCIGVGTAVVLAACVVLMAGEARGGEAPGLAAMKASEAGQGALLFKAGSAGETFAAPLLSTDVVIKVSGLVARAQVKQTFRNLSDDWHEGVYVFPLPENSAVDRLRMTIGERIVEGAIRERAAAKKDYGEAVRSGRRAALLEQERPNIFTSSVANIGPREDIVVEIEYQETLRYDSGRFSLRFPMTVGCATFPARRSPTASRAGWSCRHHPRIGRLAHHAARDPSLQGAHQPGVDPRRARCGRAARAHRQPLSPHQPAQRRPPQGHRRARKTGRRPPTATSSSPGLPHRDPEPRAAWFTERRGGKTYGLLMLLPPDAGLERRIPRESILRHRHLRLDERHLDRAGERGAAPRDRRPLPRGSLQHHRIQFLRPAALSGRAARDARAPRGSSRLGQGTARAGWNRDGARPQSRARPARKAASASGRSSFSPTDRSATRTSSSS